MPTPPIAKWVAWIRYELDGHWSRWEAVYAMECRLTLLDWLEDNGFPPGREGVGSVILEQGVDPNRVKPRRKRGT